MATPDDEAMFASTSETGEGGSVLFSEQVRTEFDAGASGVTSRSRSRSHAVDDVDMDEEGGGDGAEGDGDGNGGAMGSMFFYVDDDAVPGHAGIMTGGVEQDTTDHVDANATADDKQDPPDDNVDLKFWLESHEEGDGNDVETIAAPSASQSQAEQPQEPATIRTRSQAAREDRLNMEMFQPEHDDEMEEDEDDEDDEDDDDEPVSYHSGDSDEYEMDQRPWLERTAVKHDIQELYTIAGLYNPSLGTYRYRIVDRLGEGTFSSVYLAHDNLHNLYDNTYWTEEANVSSHDDLYAPSSTKVALKKILVTSSPARVENELSILENLRGCRNVSPLISAFRDEDQIVIILPFHQSDDFRYFYRLMDPPKIQQYMTCLMRALKDVHARGIIHRDVKPANFLFDYESGHGVLVDFGLAERYQPPRRPTCQHEPATRQSLHGVRTKTADTVSVEQAVYDARKRAKSGEGRIGFRQEDSRPSIKTNRAGTRGFRAPEVVLKCPDQTVAIDVWSAGIVLLSILSHKFPVFNSSDDVEALMEIAAVFGRGAMERCAMLHNRTIMSNVPSVDSPPDSLAALILRLNPHLYTPHQAHPTPEEAMQHITMIDSALDLCGRLLRLDSTTRITASAALRHTFLANPEDDGPDELLDPTEGKCGNLHEVTDDGQHQARFGETIEDMRFGQGIPPTRDSFCPEHEHWQQRSGLNPIGAAFGVTVDDEYHLHAGFHVAEAYSGWDDLGARDERPVV